MSYVVVLILNYNGKGLLEECLSSYLSNDYHNFDVVLIDNGSSDGSIDFVSLNFPEVIIKKIQNNKGYSGGFNVGLKFAFDVLNADFVVVSNNDVKSDNKLIEGLVETINQDKKIGFVTGKVYWYDYKGKTNILQTVGKSFSQRRIIGNHIGIYEEDKGQYDKIQERHSCDDVFSMVRKEVYQEVGGYDETFFHEFEEADWQLRAKSKGFKIYYTYKSKLWHKNSVTTGGQMSPNIIFHRNRNQIILIKKHGSFQQTIGFVMIHIFILLPKFIFVNLIKTNYQIAVSSLKGSMFGLLWSR